MSRPFFPLPSVSLSLRHEDVYALKLAMHIFFTPPTPGDEWCKSRLKNKGPMLVDTADHKNFHKHQWCESIIKVANRL